MVNEHQIGLRRGYGSSNLLKLADAQQCSWIRTVAALDKLAYDFRAGRGGEFAEFGERLLRPHPGCGSIVSVGGCLIVAAEFLAARSTGDNCAWRHSKIAVGPGTVAEFNGYKKRPLRVVTAGDDASRLA